MDLVGVSVICGAGLVVVVVVGVSVICWCGVKGWVEGVEDGWLVLCVKRQL